MTTLDTATDTTACDWLDAAQARAVQREFGTPSYLYDQRALESQAARGLAFPSAFGLTVRYAMKACPSAAVIRVLTGCGLQIDASSGYEARRALMAGVAGDQIQITAQELPQDLDELMALGVRLNACSLNQLDRFGQLAPGGELSVRINPGLGSGHSQRTNVGGPSASFGIWHEYLDAQTTRLSETVLVLNQGNRTVFNSTVSVPLEYGGLGAGEELLIRRGAVERRGS